MFRIINICSLRVAVIFGVMPLFASDKPNIVIIMTDDSGYSDIGCFGGEIETPNIDLLAKYGMRMSNFYTNGRCSPTRASFVTGLEGSHVGFGGGSLGDWSREFPFLAHRGRLPYDTPIISELLKEAGYRTMMSGKWHLGGSQMKFSNGQQKEWQRSHEGWELTEEEMEADYLALPTQRGFDEFFGIYGAQSNFFFTEGEGHSIMENNGLAKLKYDRTYTMHCFTKRKDGLGKIYSRNHGKTAKAFYDSDGITDRAIEMIEDASGKEKDPFFLYLTYRAPHRPLQAPEELVQKYLPAYDDLRAIEKARIDGLIKEGLFPAGGNSKPSWFPEDENYRLQLAVHAAMVDSVDQNVGRLIEALKANGELDNTFILFFSDNGSASHLQDIMNTPYRGNKALVWEGGIKAHAIAVWPGKIEPGSIGRDQVWVGDFVPTFLELAGAEYPKSFRGKETRDLDGRDVLPLLTGGSIEPHEMLFFNDKGQQAVIYKGRWKLMSEPGWYLQTRDKPGIAYELYDLQSDPAETNNIAKSKPEMVQQLAKASEEWRIASGIHDYGELVKVRPRDPY
ncbi:MAG: sulfatase-like hydrolase/transferase [Lentimonas sp.]